MKKDEKGIKPVNVNKDVWFYPCEKKLEFVVYIGNKCTQFRITRKKLLALLKD